MMNEKTAAFMVSEPSTSNVPPSVDLSSWRIGYAAALNDLMALLSKKDQAKVRDAAFNSCMPVR